MGKYVGELNTQDVRDSMFSKDQRLEVLSYLDNKEQETGQLEMLMGNDVPSRKEFIMDNIDFELLED